MAKIKTTKAKMDQMKKRLSRAKKTRVALKYKAERANNYYQKTSRWIATHEVRK